MVDRKEIQEARAAAQEVLRLLDEVERTLRGARNWGFFDMFSKRSLFSSLIKYGKIDKAEGQLRQVQSALRRLQKELGDINLSIRESGGAQLGFLRYVFQAEPVLQPDQVRQDR
jgi:hypothetical protein